MTLLWTDALLLLLLFASVVFAFYCRGKVHLRQAWSRVMKKPLAVVASVGLLFYIFIGTLDSLHFSINGELQSAFDRLMAPIGKRLEKSYSAPLALTLFVKETQTSATGETQQVYPRLHYVNETVTTLSQRNSQLFSLAMEGVALGSVIWLIMFLVTTVTASCLQRRNHIINLIRGRTEIPWRLWYATWWVSIVIFTIAYLWDLHFHIFGTDQVGQDIFYLTLKSIRTGLLIGTLTTLVMLPFAILLGIAAGYFGGWIDDVIQYLYTTLSSIPGVLLIAAAILSLQVYIVSHPHLFRTMTERADARLLALCLILGVTSWTGLCRMLRGETLKLREIDYIQAAKALGSSRRKIILRHILPNVMHIVLIAVVLDFSFLVLAEAVLSYVGVGVDPTMASWGNMINSARLELAREPIVWWPILAAFMLMFILVLSANLFADAVRDAFDPRQ